MQIQHGDYFTGYQVLAQGIKPMPSVERKKKSSSLSQTHITMTSYFSISCIPTLENIFCSWLTINRWVLLWISPLSRIWQSCLWQLSSWDCEDCIITGLAGISQVETCGKRQIWLYADILTVCFINVIYSVWLNDFHIFPFLLGR